MKNNHSQLNKKELNNPKKPDSSKRREKKKNEKVDSIQSNNKFKHNDLRRKTYNKSNYSDLSNDLVRFIRNYIPEDDILEKRFIKKSVVKKKKIMKYLKLIHKTQDDHIKLLKDKKYNNSTEYKANYYIDETPSELIIKFPGVSSFSDRKMVINSVYEKLSDNVLLDFFTVAGKIMFEENLLQTIIKYKHKKVIFVGYSLGALVSSYILLLVTFLNKKKHHINNIKFTLYSFNSPIALPNFLQKFINHSVVAVVNERDPIVCFRGEEEDTNLYTLGGNNIMNFVKNKETGKVECIRRSNYFFADNSFFYGYNRKQDHDLKNLEESVSLFLKEMDT